MKDRVVLAYSGGLDTSVAISWIAEVTGAEVIAVAADVGQGGADLEVIRARALACGAVPAEVAAATDGFAAEFSLPRPTACPPGSAWRGPRARCPGARGSRVRASAQTG